MKLNLQPLQRLLCPPRIGVAVVSSCALLMLLLAPDAQSQTPATLQVQQEPLVRSNVFEKISPKKWFQQTDDAANSSHAYPREMKVTPRQTQVESTKFSDRTDGFAVGEGDHSAASMRVGRPLLPRAIVPPAPLPSQGRQSDIDYASQNTARTASPAMFENATEFGLAVQQTGYQQPSPRTYTNPVSGGSAVTGPDGFSPYPPYLYPPNNRGPGHEFPPHGNMMPPPGVQYPGSPINSMQPGAGYFPPPWGGGMNGGAGSVIETLPLPMEEMYPAGIYESESAPTANQPPFNQPFQPRLPNQPLGQYPPGAMGNGQQEGFPQAGDEGGRGYLQTGAIYQGRYLHSNPQTATERALVLQSENQQLRNEAQRLKMELENRTAEVLNVRNLVREQERELVDLKNQITQLKTELIRKQHDLTLAIEEKDAIQRRTDEMLKSIENNLDGLLMNSMSRNE